jgi:integrase
VTLAGARIKAEEVRDILGRGGDPFVDMEERKARLAGLSFGDVADQFLDATESGFRNEKHKAQWRSTLGDNYIAALRKRPISEVTTDDVLGVLKPIWEIKNETARRLRGRIERVLDHGKAKGLRTGENPARWAGHLILMLPTVDKLQRGHHAAMPYDQVPAFMARLPNAKGVAARALEFTILTAARSGETREAVWSEFDLDKALWTVPAVRMKGGREHRVPLPSRAVEIIREMRARRFGDLVFPGTKRKAPLSDMTMGAVLKRLKVGEFTTHGFRSSFRDWCGEATAFPREIAEAALAHIVGDETERAYRRGDALAKRRELMDAWSTFLLKRD